MLNHYFREKKFSILFRTLFKTIINAIRFLLKLSEQRKKIKITNLKALLWHSRSSELVTLVEE